jgi:hypothetical protein
MKTASVEVAWNCRSELVGTVRRTAIAGPDCGYEEITMIRSILCLTAALAMAVAAFGADISGTWTASFETQVGTQTYTYTFKVEGTKLTGTAKSNLGEGTIDMGAVKGDDVTFVEHLNFQGMQLDIPYKGKISGNEIMFTRTIMDIAEQLVAKRAK